MGSDCPVHLVSRSVTEENSREEDRGAWLPLGRAVGIDMQQMANGGDSELLLDLRRCMCWRDPWNEATGTKCWNVLGHYKRSKSFDGTEHIWPLDGKVICNRCLIYDLGVYMKFICTRAPEFTRTSLNGTHKIGTQHRGKSLWQFVGDNMFPLALYGKWMLTTAN